MATPLHVLRQSARDLLLEPYALVTPGAPLVSPQGTPGVTTVAYKITAYNATGESAGSQPGESDSSAASLSVTNFNQLTWTAVPGATGYNIYRTDAPTSPSTLGLIGTTTDTTFDDTGIAGDSASVPTINTSGIESPFWNDSDLTEFLIKGAKDLWRAIIDLHKGHFTTDDATNVTFASGGTQLTGVPADCFRVLSVEPRDLTDTSSDRTLIFRPRPYTSAAFQLARSLSSSLAGYETEYVYDLLNAGSPVSAPTIKAAPPPTSTINLRLVYVHTLGTLTENSDNPIPGESDNALVAWCMAFARSREREDRMPDPAWLSIYATDKQSLLTALTPRQEQEPEYVEGMFEGY